MQAFCEYTGNHHCEALSSGTAAMHLALKELGFNYRMNNVLAGIGGGWLSLSMATSAIQVC